MPISKWLGCHFQAIIKEFSLLDFEETKMGAPELQKRPIGYFGSRNKLFLLC